MTPADLVASLAAMGWPIDGRPLDGNEWVWL
jgi:hypothetical protein